MSDSENREPQTPRWDERLEEEPSIDIDYWTLLVEARILQSE